MDPLSEIISLLHPHSCVAAGLDAGGDWSVRFDRHAGLKCNAVLKGSGWLSVDGGEPLRLNAGDCMILPHGRPFVLSPQPAPEACNATAIYQPVRHGGTAVYGGGGDFFMTGSRFLLSGTPADMLLQSLPPVLVVRSGTEQAAVRWAIEGLAQELRDPMPGAAIAIEHLAHFVLVQVIRLHLASSPAQTSGWIAAMSDPYLSRAVAALHGQPAEPWTVQELASRAGLSRTAFAVRFRKITGQTPMGYLTQLRMLFAADMLRRTNRPIAHIAAEAGYASESAFTAAFRRTTGHPPRRYVQGLKTRPIVEGRKVAGDRTTDHQFF